MRFELTLTDDNGDTVHQWVLEPDGNGGVETISGGAIHNRVGFYMKQWAEVEALRRADSNSAMPDFMFAALTEAQERAARDYVRRNYKVGDPIPTGWHPVQRQEAQTMFAEQQMKKTQ